MITFTATEVRQNLNVPFTYYHPLYRDVIQESYKLYTNAGINVTIETSADGFVQTITHSFPDDKLELFTTLHAQVVGTIEEFYLNTDKNLPFARSSGIETTQTQSFDADHVHLDAIFASHYKLR